MEKEHPILKSLESKIESKRLLRKNTFILKLLNDIGCYLDKEFNILKEFDMEIHFDIIPELYNQFIPLCKEKMEKRNPLHLIFVIIVQIDVINQHFENIINYNKQILLSDNYSKIQQVIFDKLMNEELKYCLDKERYSFVWNYSKKFVGDILILFDILSYCLTEEDNNYLIKRVLEDLKEKYKNVIIPDSLLDSIEIKKENYFKLLNQLLELNYEEIKSIKILIFKELKFEMKESSNEKLQKYIQADSMGDKKKKKKKKKKLSNNNSIQQSGQQEDVNSTSIQQFSSIIESSNIQSSQENIISEIDINNMSPLEKFLYFKLEKVENELKKQKIICQKLMTR